MEEIKENQENKNANFICRTKKESLTSVVEERKKSCEENEKVNVQTKKILQRVYLDTVSREAKERYKRKRERNLCRRVFLEDKSSDTEKLKTAQNQPTRKLNYLDEFDEAEETSQYEKQKFDSSPTRKGKKSESKEHVATGK